MSSLDWALREGERWASWRQRSTATTHRKTGNTVQNETTGAKDPEWAAIYTDVPFRLSGASRGASSSRTISAADVKVELGNRTGHFSAGLTDFQDGDLIEITDGDNAATVWQIIEADWADQKTAHRFPVVSVKRPSEWGAP